MPEGVMAAEVMPQAAQIRHDAAPGHHAGAVPTRGPVIQAKLRVGAAGDSFEREADAVAAKVVRALQSDQGRIGVDDGGADLARVRRAVELPSAAGEPVELVAPVQRIQRAGRIGGDDGGAELARLRRAAEPLSAAGEPVELVAPVQRIQRAGWIGAEGQVSQSRQIVHLQRISGNQTAMRQLVQRELSDDDDDSASATGSGYSEYGYSYSATGSGSGSGSGGESSGDGAALDRPESKPKTVKGKPKTVKGKPKTVKGKPKVGSKGSAAASSSAASSSAAGSSASSSAASSSAAGSSASSSAASSSAAGSTAAASPASGNIDTVMADVDDWLKKKAEAGGQHMLMEHGPYMKLSSDQKVRVFEKCGVNIDVSDPKSFHGLMQGRLWKTVNWQKFAQEVRQASPTASQSAADGAALLSAQLGKGNLAAMAVGALVSGGTKEAEAGQLPGVASDIGITEASNTWAQNNRDGAFETMGGAELLTAATGFLGNLLVLWKAGDDLAIQDWTSVFLETGSKVLGALAGLAQSAGSAIRTGAAIDEGYAVGQMSYAGDASGALAGNALLAVGTTIFAGAAAVKGLCQIVGGTKDLYSAIKESSVLQELQKTITTRDFKSAIRKAEATQNLKGKLAAGHIAQGTATMAGSAVIIVGLVAGVSNPIGWALLACGGVIGGLLGVYKIAKTKKNTKDFVKSVLSASTTPLTDEQVDVELAKRGYKQGDLKSFHEDFMKDLALSIHTAAFAPDPSTKKTEARAFLAATNMAFNEGNKTPNVEQIKMHLVGK
jgi:hypothetical protein